MQHANEIATESRSTIDIALSVNALEKISSNIPRRQLQRVAHRHVSLADNIGRINDLRVSKPHFAAFTCLGAKVHPPDGIRANNSANPAQGCAKV